MSGAELLWAVCPGKVIVLVAASMALGALLALLLAALFSAPDVDEFEL